jgi:hypothetical protein
VRVLLSLASELLGADEIAAGPRLEEGGGLELHWPDLPESD